MALVPSLFLYEYTFNSLGLVSFSIKKIHVWRLSRIELSSRTSRGDGRRLQTNWPIRSFSYLHFQFFPSCQNLTQGSTGKRMTRANLVSLASTLDSNQLHKVKDFLLSSKKFARNLVLYSGRYIILMCSRK